jgi:hypothetical protein
MEIPCDTSLKIKFEALPLLIFGFISESNMAKHIL